MSSFFSCMLIFALSVPSDPYGRSSKHATLASGAAGAQQMDAWGKPAGLVEKPCEGGILSSRRRDKHVPISLRNMLICFATEHATPQEILLLK
jgi:hypothetical protein